MTADVVIVGGGPVGLLLASELKLAGVSPVVLERLPEINGAPKSNGLVGRIIDVLEYRGLLDRFVAVANYAGPRPIFEFSGLLLDLRVLGENPLRRISITQLSIERALNDRALELGVDLRRGHEVSAVAQDDDGVSLTVSGPEGEYELRARYAVGADGGRSLIRRQAGIAFSGTTDQSVVTLLGDVDVPETYVDAQTEELLVPGIGRVKVGLTRTDSGVFAHVIRGGLHRVATIEWNAEPGREDGPITLAELSAGVKRVLGAELPMSNPSWLVRRFENTRQADRYREGRIFLVGDSAHVHSSLGGPGLNLGLQDAVNLGWKLAGEILGWAPPGLLDTYQAERYPVGQRVIMFTVAQTGLLAPGTEVSQIRSLFADLLEEPAALRHFIAMFAGTDVHYDFGSGPGGLAGQPDLVGRWAPDFRVITEAGETRVAELTRDARPLLLDLSPDGAAAAAAERWADRVKVVRARVQSPSESVTAVLIRPDGYVAWAAEPPGPDERALAGLGEALATWFGAAA